jgi:uncharacterized LabA/DUF88 family protein
MDQHVRVFVDFWNFQLTWNDRTGKARCDWPKMPILLVQQATEELHSAGIGEALLLEETRVYASVAAKSAADEKLRNCLDGFLDRLPGFRVFVRERRSSIKPIRCCECGARIANCPQCAKPFRRTVEKGIDAAIVTDLFSLAWEKAYNIAILVSSDADFVPAVERIQEKGFKVINATWKGQGNLLAKTCWASFDIDGIADSLKQS